MVSTLHLPLHFVLAALIGLGPVDVSHSAHTVCASVPGQGKPVLDADVPTPDAPRLGPLRRIVVIGASASAGFGTSVNLADALDAAVVAPHDPVQNQAEHVLFLSPEALGEGMVEKARAAEPTLVVAIDFLFWFGYGTFDREEERLDLLERGLAMLAPFDCPILVSTFPDMSAAVGKMLAPSQVPSKESFDALNARVLTWVENHPRAILFPLPEMLARLKSGEPFDIAGHTWPPAEDVELLQADELHPTIEGLASLACEVILGATAGREDVAPQPFPVDPGAVTRALQQRAADRRSAREELRKGAPKSTAK